MKLRASIADILPNYWIGEYQRRPIGKTDGEGLWRSQTIHGSRVRRKDTGANRTAGRSL